MRVHFDSVNGVLTRYYQAGSGLPVILVHGVGVLSDSWIRNLEPLGQHFSVYAPDLLASGMTDRGRYEGGAPQPFLVDHLADFVDHIKAEKFVLVGSSLGALISALLYFRMPERVHKLVLVNCGSLLGDYDERLRDGIVRSRTNGRAAFLDPTPEVCRQRMGNICFDAETVPESVIVMQMTCHALPGALSDYEKRMEGLLDFETGQKYSVGTKLAEISVPTLVVWGKQDPRGPYERAVEQFAAIKGARIVGVEKCGHLPHLEHPDIFNREVAAFLLEGRP